MKLLFIFLACMIGLSSCTKKTTTHYQASGTITGMDLGACSCCGGYILKINGNDSIYRFYYFPAGSGIDTTHFPINVNINYTETGTCTPAQYHYLIIQSLQKVD